jgi:hypothetical protein
MTAARMVGWMCALVCGAQSVSTGAPSDAAAARLAEASLERRVFRHILVGKIRYPSERLTWVLSRGATHTQLEVFCQEGQKQPSTGIRVDGAETSEAYWLPPMITRYVGRKMRDNPLRYELSSIDVPHEGSWCASAPSTLILDCRPANTSVLSAGAVLVPGKKRDDDTMTPAHWKPALRHTVAALRCMLEPGSGVAAWRPAGPAKTAPLLFAPAAMSVPDVEWADENSDMVVQEGAYRQILAESSDSRSDDQGKRAP